MRFTSCVAGAMAALAACTAWAPGPLAAARDLTGLPIMSMDAQATETFTHPTVSAAASSAGHDLEAASLADLSHDGRQLHAITAAVGVLSNLAGTILDAFLGFGAGEAVSAIFGSQEVPVNLAKLFDDALEEIDRIVGDQISEAFTNEKKTLLNSLGRQVREYVRRDNLETSLDDVGDMLTAASDLLSFFESNGLVTNAAFQTTLALRLSLLLEQLQLDQLLGESDATLDAVKRNIRNQARNGRATLQQWASTFSPVENEISETRSRPCAGFLPSGGCRDLSTSETTLGICMIMGSPRLQRPDRFCKQKTCKSNHLFSGVRRDRIERCLKTAAPLMRGLVQAHARTVGIVQFRERNEATIFGEGFKAFMEDLESVENLEFDDVGLPDVGSEPAGASG